MSETLFSIASSLPVGNLKPGKRFLMNDKMFVVLGHTSSCSACLMTPYWRLLSYGQGQVNYLHSNIRRQLNSDFYNELVEYFGPDGIVEHAVDLSADDGTDYNHACLDMVSVISARDYRMYRQFIKPSSESWWTATPVSAKKGIFEDQHLYIVPKFGVLGRENNLKPLGVRPFFYLKSEKTVIPQGEFKSVSL